MILVGIDDTDTLDSPGTNQLARRIAERVPSPWSCRRVLRHQLFFDPRVPYTSHNGSASLLFEGDGDGLAQLVAFLQAQLRDWYVPGSDPGLCVATRVPDAVIRFARACQREIVTQDAARSLAAAHGLHLEGFGGTNGGVIGALAAVGLLAQGRDGRVIHLGGWTWPDDFTGIRPVVEIRARGVDEVRVAPSGEVLESGFVDVGKHLRPNIIDGRIVLLVEAAPDHGSTHRWNALRLS